MDKGPTTITQDIQSFLTPGNTRTMVLRGLLSGGLYLALAWLAELLLSDVEFSLKALWNLHKTHPALFLVALFPVFMMALAYWQAKLQNRARQKAREAIEERQAIIERNVELAQRIGQREQELDEIQVPENDPLGKELLVMRRNLYETDRKEQEQNWLSEGKDNISDILRQNNTIEDLAYHTLEGFIKYIKAVQGSFYIYDEDKDKIVNIATYAYNRRKYVNQEFQIGEGLIGEAAYEMDLIYRREIPNDYTTITSGILGDKKPRTLLILPLISDEKLQGIIEVASLHDELPELTLQFARELGTIIGQTVFNLKVNARTERLLQDSQVMTKELRANEEELRKNAVEMQKTQEQLERSNRDLEKQIEEVENAQKRLHALLENASEVISIYDKNGIVTYESPSVKRILGYSPESVVGHNIYEDFDSEAFTKIQNALETLKENPRETVVFEYTYHKDDQNTLYLEATGRNLLDDPAINGFIFNTRDITVRKIAEQAEKRSGQMQALSENSVDMILRINVNGEFFYVNPIVEKYTGILASNIINKMLDEVGMQQEITETFRDILDVVKESSENHQTERTFPTMDGEKIMQVNGIPEFNEESEVESVLLVAHDITERKLIEKEIRAKNKAINDSINYAQRIQTSILPDEQLIRNYLPKSFIFYRARDVVSGDFPWFFEDGNKLYIAAVDCTGHGVPGAMLSFIGYFLLNNIVSQHPDWTASEILDEFHQGVRKTLRQDRVNASARDGMDIAFMKIDKDQKRLDYSGAHRPLFLLRDKELQQFKGDPKAIGGIPHRRKTEQAFTNYHIDYQPKDKVFFFSDGLPDQVGGPKGRKMKTIHVRELIQSHSDKDMETYHQVFEEDFDYWKGDNKQIDDLLLIGIEF